MPTWDSASADALWTEACGKGRWSAAAATLDRDVRGISDARLWQFRNSACAALVDYTRERLSRQLAASGALPAAAEEAGHLFDPDVPTLGFARRVATYKPLNLLLHDRERLLRLLCNLQRPAQLVIAGKAHPEDGRRQPPDQGADRVHPAVGYHARSADKGRIGTQLVSWQQELKQKWVAQRFGERKMESNADHHAIEVRTNAIRKLCASGSTPGALMAMPPCGYRWCR